MFNKHRTGIQCRPFLCASLTLILSLPASADDTDVFDAIIKSQSKPNVLFVLDYSDSMLTDVNNKKITDSSVPSKLNVLQSAVEQLLESNRGDINVGIGSLFGAEASGIKWPVSDLQADAHTIDPAIPPDTKTVEDIINIQLQTRGTTWHTTTINALAEAATYFSGGPVLHNDADTSFPPSHKPAIWDVENEQYQESNIHAANAASYTPANAYEYNVNEPGNYAWCTDWEDGTQGCEGKLTFDCTYDAGGNWTRTVADDDGELQTTSGTRPPHTTCKFEHEDAWRGATYNSPIQECQSNFIVLISDGLPTRINETTGLANVLSDAGVPGGLVENCDDLSKTIFSGRSGTRATAGNCGPEILEYMAKNDLNASIENSHVKTYTVGFSINNAGKQYMELLAEKGQGAFYEATQPAELTNALNTVIDSILSDSYSFSEISIDVDRASFSHDDKAFLPLYSPNRTNSWKGNLKGFFLNQTGLIDIKGEDAIVNDGSGNKIAESSQSFWSSIVDGNQVLEGGASEGIVELGAAPNTRNLLTYLGGGKVLPLDSSNRLEKDNANVTDDLLGNPGATIRDEALDWLANAPMGDPLHTKPVVVNYPDRTVVYSMTNQGFLHAFDTSNPVAPSAEAPDVSGGAEIFAFMPKELLVNIPDHYQPINSFDHLYGLDGSITRWHNDPNNDGIVNDGPDSMLLIFGMRRGGTHYYALDVTNPDLPEFKWQISSTDAEFAKMAQSWSRMSLISVNNGGTPARMLMFGGGYDAALVDDQNRSTRANGNAIFLIDREGNLVFSVDNTDHTDMVYSIPSDLTIIDSDQDKLADRAYFGDLGGQVWRLDFDDVKDASNIHLTKLADINDGNYQPIFYAPSVTRITEKGKQYLAVAFGTGDRTHPLFASSQNAFFMVRDRDHEAGPPAAGFSTIKKSDLYDATSNDIGSSDDSVSDAARVALSNSHGWFVSLNTGEKSLSKVVTFQDKFMATTFEQLPAGSTSGVGSACTISTLGRLYIMSITDARPIEILADGSESYHDPNSSKRVTELGSLTIPSSPQVVFPKGSSQVQIMVDKETVDHINQQVRTVFWHSK